MQKTILITGSTDGIGLETAKRLVKEGHKVLIHGRNEAKLQETKQMLSELNNANEIYSYVADLSDLNEVESFAKAVINEHKELDALINNAGVYNLANPITKDKLDARFVVNTIAPYLLTKRLFPLLNKSSRVVNLSSAAQYDVSTDALRGKKLLANGEAYAQSKLAITMWSFDMAKQSDAPVIIAVNPKSFLGSKMVKEAYGVAGADLSIGADILCRAALADDFSNASGKYFDNDIGQFAPAHPDAYDEQKIKKVVQTIEEIIKDNL